MKNRILVDTTIWIDFFRPRSKTGNQLEILLKENVVWTCGIVIFEILQGIKSMEEKNKLLDLLGSLPYVEMTKELWKKSADLSFSLKRDGFTLPLSDILIATIALENEFFLYTIDKHFSQIPNLKLYSF